MMYRHKCKEMAWLTGPQQESKAAKVKQTAGYLESMAADTTNGGEGGYLLAPFIVHGSLESLQCVLRRGHQGKHRLSHLLYASCHKISHVIVAGCEEALKLWGGLHAVTHLSKEMRVGTCQNHQLYRRS